ncbi:Uncharacterised protein [uncultured archaeon]|nr:Uncharacterised protein [uncultured archaeon]
MIIQPDTALIFSMGDREARKISALITYFFKDNFDMNIRIKTYGRINTLDARIDSDENALVVFGHGTYPSKRIITGDGFRAGKDGRLSEEHTRYRILETFFKMTADSCDKRGIPYILCEEEVISESD